MKRNVFNGKMWAMCLALILVLTGCGNSPAGNVQQGEDVQSSEQVASGTDASGSTGEESTVDGAGQEEIDTQVGEESSEQPSQEESKEPEIPAEPEIESLKAYCEKYFKLGVGINGSTLDNLTLNNEQYMEMVKQHFNSVTLSNLMKSCYILKQDLSIENAKNGDGTPVLTYECIDPTLQWCMDNGVGMRGHTLVWHTQAPDWFFREGYESDGAYVDKKTMLGRMESYIQQLMTHVQDNYPGVVYCWDVVNEAVDPDKGDPNSDFYCRTELDGTPNPWYVTIGEDYVEMAFTYARKYAAEGVKLFYNDFNTYDTKKREYIYTLCEGLKEKGLIDGIGMQGYYGTSYPNQNAIEGTIIRFSELELELQLTEFSVSVDEENEEQFKAQAQRYFNILLALHNYDIEGGGKANITNVTFFGLIDHYVPGDKTNSRLWDKNFEPKPAYDKVKAVLKNVYGKN